MMKKKIENRYITCCHCWHIKNGTAILGFLELLVIIFFLSGITNRIIRKSINECAKNNSKFFRFVKECLTQFDWKQFWDNILLIILIVFILCILLLFIGISRKSPILLLPHIIAQGICLIFSVLYFIFHAWGYFYIDLYFKHDELRLMDLLERMWLATLLLIFAAFQLYCITIVIKCCVYLQMLRDEQLRKFALFQDCSERVRKAKQMGLWNNLTKSDENFEALTNYQGKAHEHATKKGKFPHVKWNLQNNMERSITVTEENSSSYSDYETQKYQESTNKRKDCLSMHPSSILKNHSLNSQSKYLTSANANVEVENRSCYI